MSNFQFDGFQMTYESQCRTDRTSGAHTDASSRRSRSTLDSQTQFDGFFSDDRPSHMPILSLGHSCHCSTLDSQSTSDVPHQILSHIRCSTLDSQPLQMFHIRCSTLDVPHQMFHIRLSVTLDFPHQILIHFRCSTLDVPHQMFSATVYPPHQILSHI